MLDLQIKPLKGIGDVTFGMPATAVRQVFGEPDQSVIDIKEDLTDFTSKRLIYSRKWIYESLGITMTFSALDESPFDLRLRSITIESRDATIDGVQLVGLMETKFLDAVATTQLGDVELVSDLRSIEPGNPECDIREYACESVRMTFWIVERFVTSICMWDEWRATRDIAFKSNIKLGIPDTEEDN